MEVLMGVVLTLFVEGLFWFAWRTWRSINPPVPPPQPPSSGQAANLAALNAHQAATPVVRRVGFRRPVQRGRRRRIVEDERNQFE